MKSIRFSLFCVLLTTSFLPNVEARMSGFLVGAHLGALQGGGDHKYQDKFGATNNLKIQSFAPVFGLHGGGLFEVGKHIFIGFEAAFSGSSSSKTLSITDSNGQMDGKVTVKRKSNIGFGIVAGMALNPKILAFAKLSYDVTGYTLDYSELNFGTRTTFSYKKSMGSIVPGAGLFYFLSKSFSIGFEYQAAILYKKFLVRRITENISGAYRGFIFKPKEQRLLLKASFHF